LRGYTERFIYFNDVYYSEVAEMLMYGKIVIELFGDDMNEAEFNANVERLQNQLENMLTNDLFDDFNVVVKEVEELEGD